MVRFKNRYIACEIEIKEDKSYEKIPFTSSQLSKSIINIVQEIHGDYGVASITQAFQVKYFNDKTWIAFIRTRHGPHRFVSSSLPILKHIDKHKVSLRILYVGATLKMCYKFLAKYQRHNVWKFHNSLNNKKILLYEENFFKQIIDTKKKIDARF